MSPQQRKVGMLKNNVEVDVKVKCIEGDVTQAKLTEEIYHLMNGKFCGEAWDAVSRYRFSWRLHHAWLDK